MQTRTDALRPAAFLDRDGILNEDRGYLHDPAELVWIAEAGDALGRLDRAGYLIFVVTNQSGIGRGFYREADVIAVHAHMQEALGGLISDFRYCPHHPEAELEAYRRVCECRKPAPGMIEALCRDYPVDRARSFLIGDRESDVEAARAARIPGHLFSGGSLDAFVARILSGMR